MAVISDGLAADTRQAAELLEKLYLHCLHHAKWGGSFIPHSVRAKNCWALASPRTKARGERDV